MEFSFGKGKHEFPGNRFVNFRELEVEVYSGVFLGIRMYPTNTFVSYRNTYRRFTKIYYKANHQDAQKEMPEVIAEIFKDIHLKLSPNNLAKIILFYGRLVNSNTIGE